MNRFSNLAEITFGHRLVLPPPHPWRVVPDSQAKHGEIHGIHTVCGQLVATNGILALLATSSDCFSIGHLEWFEPYEDQPDDAPSDNLNGAKTPRRRASRIQKELEVCAGKEYI